jgi:hypothetical protein
MTNEVDEMPAASRGSHGKIAVEREDQMDDIVRNLRAAAAVLLEAQEHVPIRGGEVMLNLHKRADELNAAADEIERLRLTSAERAGIQEAVNEFSSWGSLVAQQITENLRGLLERTK